MSVYRDSEQLVRETDYGPKHDKKVRFALANTPSQDRARRIKITPYKSNREWPSKNVS